MIQVTADPAGSFATLAAGDINTDGEVLTVDCSMMLTMLAFYVCSAFSVNVAVFCS